jgi:uncharacterized protein YndB with AHSA1/START domain
MRHFSISVAIAAPPARVYEVMTDIERWPEWTASVAKIRRLGPAPLAVGSRAIIWQPKFPPALWTVTANEPGRSFTWVSTAPGLRVIGHHRVDHAAAGSLATLTLQLDGVFGGLWGRLTGGITTRYLRLEAAGLKTRSEAAV